MHVAIIANIALVESYVKQNRNSLWEKRMIKKGM